MRSRTRGFTLIELVIVIMIGSVLTGIALSGFQNVQSRYAVNSAKRVYMSWHQRARSLAIETGETIIMVVWVNGDSAATVRRDGATFNWSNFQHFDEELDVTLETQGNQAFYTCMTPRGYADTSCGSWGPTLGLGATFNVDDTIRLRFRQNVDTASVLILPMGQVIG